MAPHFKKLTDCPENLREAIDWLIQVRHGGDGQGLEHLAKALKKFIEGAIQRAYTSFCDNLCTILDSAGQKYKCCREKIEVIKALKAETNKAGNVEENKLQALLDKVKAFKNGCETNHRVDTSTDKALDDVQSRLEKLDGFRKNLSGFTSDPTPVLKQLCTGLETFLGFNSESKGYTGTGIVYSDLDRLCDAVMGFLSGVLSAVKDDDAVKTYDKDISGDKIDTVISKLQSSIGSGRAGLVASVEKVREWLEGYDLFLTNNTNHVIEAFKTIQKVNFNHISNSLIALNDCSPSDVAKKIGDCIDKANKLPAAFKEASNEVHSRLDPQLRKQLQNTVRNVEVAVEKFVAGATNTEFKELLQQGEHELQVLQHEVKNKVEKRIHDLQNSLQNTFNKDIHEPVISVKYRLNVLNEKLEQWIQKANLVVSAALRKVEAILAEVKEKDGHEKPDKWRAIETAAEHLTMKAKELYGLALHAKGEVRSTVKKALSQVTRMDRSVKYGLGEVKTQIENRMRSYFSEYVGLVRKTITKITDQNGLEGIRIKVKKWAEGFGNDERGYRTFGDKVADWVTEIVNVNEFVKGQLKSYITHGDNRTKLVGNLNSSADEFDRNGVLQIAEVIKRELLTHSINAAGQRVQELLRQSSDAGADIDRYVTAVQTGCSVFARRLGAEMKKPNHQVQTFVKRIADMIEVALMTDKTSTHNSNLTFAVEYILNDLVVAATQSGEELYSFATGDSNMSEKVHAALELGENINEAFRQALLKIQDDGYKETASFDPYTSTSVDVKHNISKTITTVVDKEIGKADEGGETDKFALPHHFKTYKDCVNTSAVNNLKLELTGEAQAEGYLPLAIGDILKHVEATDALGKIESGSSPDSVSPVHMNRFYVNTFEDLCNKVTDALGILCNEVKALVENSEKENGRPGNKRGVQYLLKDLQQMLGEGEEGEMYTLEKNLKQIHEEIKTTIIGTALSDIVEGTPTTLTAIIAKAADFYHKIRTDSQKCIDDLKGDLQKEATAAREAIQNTAKVLYYKNVSKGLEEMERRVERNITTITTIINNDLKSGVKGLLKTMNASGDKLVTLIDKRSVEEFSPIWSKVSDAILQYVKWQADLLGEPPAEAQATVQAHRPLPPPISGGGYRARPATPTAPKSNTNRKARTSSSSDQQSNQVSAIHLTLERLFYFMQQFGHFNVTFQNNLTNVKDAVSRLNPTKFSGDRNPLLLDVLKCGVESFVTELDRAYVSTYSGRGISWDDATEGRNVAKAFFTLLNIVVDDLTTLKDKCEDNSKYGWKGKMLCKTQNRTGNSLGAFFERCGYQIPTDDSGKQDAELQCKNERNSEFILQKLVETTTQLSGTRNVMQDLKYLYELSDKYNEVCHLSTFDARKNPCSVYDMLIWLTGLPYNVAHPSLLREGIGGLLENPHKALADKDDGLDLSVFGMNDFYLDAHPSKITYHDIDNTIHHITSNAYDIITCISGTGDEATFYGSDLCNNSFKFKYPTSGEECLDMLLDILRRLFPPLKFLLTQCSYPATLHGWSQCEYGKNVSTTKWPCKKHSRSESACQANCQPTCRPNDQPNCEPKSPLMSYLNDCLPGHLPHQLTDIGCKYKCETCPKSTPGQPCLTPLGFRGFSGSTKTGKELCRVLNEFFDDRNLSALFGLSIKTPTTLPEHFGFVSCLVKGWVQKSSMVGENIQTAFHKSISSRSIALYKEPSELTDALRNAYGDARPAHVDQSHLAAYAALSHLSMTTCSDPNQKAYCAPYITSLCGDAYTCLPFKNSNTYLSWAVYLPWDFWQLLNNFYSDFRNILCQDWGCRTCLRADKCRRGQHGLVEKLDNKAASPHCKCPSIVQCRGVSPTLYRYGFVFGEASTLNDGNSKKLCSDFCTQLNDVLNSQYFKNLFTKCDNFLFTIRAPFIWLNVALWLLSLLYLIHIMVIRLDLLHIKSHLHSPSSHRIAAQSLLAAARVNKLGRVFYLQP